MLCHTLNQGKRQYNEKIAELKQKIKPKQILNDPDGKKAPGRNPSKKIHKTPGASFIGASKNCSTKPLSDAISKVL